MGGDIYKEALRLIQASPIVNVLSSRRIPRGEGEPDWLLGFQNVGTRSLVVRVDVGGQIHRSLRIPPNGFVWAVENAAILPLHLLCFHEVNVDVIDGSIEDLRGVYSYKPNDFCEKRVLWTISRDSVMVIQGGMMKISRRRLTTE